jgi:bacteriocin-like protein
MEIEEMSKDKPKSAKPDSLAKPRKAGATELSESELKTVSGGGTATKTTTTTTTTNPTESVSLNFTKIG